MPNFSVSEQMIHMPVWVENPTQEPMTWRFDSEYTTFTPGMFRNLETGELWPMDFSLAVHFQKSLPALVIHMNKPVAQKKTINVEELGEKSIDDMTMQELRHYGASIGKVFPVGVTKKAVVAELKALKEGTTPEA